MLAVFYDGLVDGWLWMTWGLGAACSVVIWGVAWSLIMGAWKFMEWCVVQMWAKVKK